MVSGYRRSSVLNIVIRLSCLSVFVTSHALAATAMATATQAASAPRTPTPPATKASAGNTTTTTAGTTPAATGTTTATTAAKTPTILFEGYSKVLLSGTHVGFVVQRYEFDSVKKEFISTYFLKTNANGGGITESLKARATMGLKPISYQYTELAGGKAKTIDASFFGNKMTAIVKEGTKSATIRKDIPDGAFLSTFLVYMMLNNKEGIKPEVRYSYKAIAEEDVSVLPGEASVVSQEKLNGMTVFKVFNRFKGTRFASYLSAKGEIISTRSPVQAIATELVASVQEATAGMSFNAEALRLLFGNVPLGKENALVRRETQSAPTAAASSDTNGKTEGR